MENSVDSKGIGCCFGGDRVSISKQRWDCLWDRVSILKITFGLLKESNLEE